MANLQKKDPEGEKLKDREGMIKHLREHVNYPASKQQLAEACNRMSHTPHEDRDWFMKTLPDKTYKSADEVMGALGMSA